MQIRTADFRIDRVEIRRLRFNVFVNEQQVPEDEELDDRDEHCRHVLAIDAGTAVGTGRIDLEAGGKIGRVAVAASHRGRGIGTALVGALENIAQSHGLSAVWCNAQTAAAPFYEGLGYRTTGSLFLEAGIEHVRMEKTL